MSRGKAQKIVRSGSFWRNDPTKVGTVVRIVKDHFGNHASSKGHVTDTPSDDVIAEVVQRASLVNWTVDKAVGQVMAQTF
jgi:hypothetical protein